MILHLYFLGSLGAVNEVSYHAPHLIDSSGSMTPSALIPFCAYQTNTTLLGQTRQGLPFPVCSQFKPTVLEGQLCYSLNLSKIASDKTAAGLDNGILIILDLGTSDKEENRLNERETLGDEKFISLKMDPFNPSETTAQIYLNTLSSISDYRAGSYALTSLKKMTGTESFLKQSDDNKKCRTQSKEDCQTARYIDIVQKNCGCVPWSLRSALTIKVGLFQNKGGDWHSSKLMTQILHFTCIM